MLDQIETYVLLFVIIVVVGVVFRKVSTPTPLLLVIAGMAISFIPHFPHISLKPALVLDLILPLIIYEASAFISWRDVKVNFIPIAFLSVGHVIFITCLVAVVMHYIIPGLSWPLAFLLGAVISPPDDVAIVAIAETIHMPNKLITILKGEGLLNDATALILYRFALLALITHEFSLMDAAGSFVMIVVGETCYGFVLAKLIGEIRLRIHDTKLQMVVSILTPFLAYLPPERLGGSGVLATVVTGIVIGYQYLDRFSPDVRLIGVSVWNTLTFILQSILFLLIGLDLRFITGRISVIPLQDLILYGCITVLVVIVGRFFLIFAAAYVPRFLFPSFRKKNPYPRWQYPFVISWAGMRGGVSLAAALAIPFLPSLELGENPRDLIIFLVFCVIAATLLLQGLSLPWILKTIGIPVYEESEKYKEHVRELTIKYKLAKAVERWLHTYLEQIKHDESLLAQAKFHHTEYRMLAKQYSELIKKHGEIHEHDPASELRESVELSSLIIQVERIELDRLWKEEKIPYAVRMRLMHDLDLRWKRLMG